MSKGRIALPVGHEPSHPGVTLADGQTEHAFNRTLAGQLWQDLNRLGVSCDPFYRREDLGYTSGMRELCRRINEWRPDIVVSLHSNGHKNPAASGAEGLHWPATADEADRPEVTPSGDNRERDLAAVLAAAYSSILGIRNRGTIPQSHSWNGPVRFHATALYKGAPKEIPGGPELWIHSLTEAPCAIGESHFMSNPDDHAAALAALSSGALSAALATALAHFLEIQP